jgi:hypothetical protein
MSTGRVTDISREKSAFTFIVQESSTSHPTWRSILLRNINYLLVDTIKYPRRLQHSTTLSEPQILQSIQRFTRSSVLLCCKKIWFVILHNFNPISLQNYTAFGFRCHTCTVTSVNDYKKRNTVPALKAFSLIQDVSLEQRYSSVH